MKTKHTFITIFLSVVLCAACEETNVETLAGKLTGDSSGNSSAETQEEVLELGLMNNTRMHEILQRIDPELQGRLGSWLLQHESLPVQVITDENADRMRVIVPIAKEEDLGKEELVRLMQANFDSVLDARYSIANGVVWSAFIHPLSILSDEEFVSGLAQAITAAHLALHIAQVR